jgi:hypothetical protein
VKKIDKKKAHKETRRKCMAASDSSQCESICLFQAGAIVMEAVAAASLSVFLI